MGLFNSNTDALQSRADINARGAKHDLEDWIIGLLPSLKGLHILDMGCGTGKQIFRLAPLVTHEGQILGVDVSRDAVRVVNQRAESDSLPFIEARQMDFDQCPGKLADRCFDVIISSYAIYYAHDTVGLLKELRSVLKGQGIIFVCGPGKGTNIEMQSIVNRFSRNAVKSIDDFLSPNDIKEIAGAFSQFKIWRLNNVIVFNSADAVLSWWQNHNSFDPSVAGEVSEFIHAHFAERNTFELTKNVLGVRFDVRSI